MYGSSVATRLGGKIQNGVVYGQQAGIRVFTPARGGEYVDEAASCRGQ